MLEAVNDWTESIDESAQVDVIYLDYAKAFDRVPHDILLGKLVDANLNPNLIKWIRSYLSNRTFCCGRRVSIFTTMNNQHNEHVSDTSIYGKKRKKEADVTSSTWLGTKKGEAFGSATFRNVTFRNCDDSQLT
uniref:Reverse transcriptase domain-containing protein n=1 Tax=Caenorhabditis japonica TaxID=281687 RepID=A0A8R1I2A8_CAEJA